ncbi:hypothetical protein BE17_17805 [Sorangium cellulosum]|uniref:Uncharacterized protein n=1 Tax=Sorangium cellulosum TaxID=56 RepID=A0A150RC02_SORCE|nr:hypothetical protein BE17_17805 [Sorangium cellulosum]
MCGVPSGVWQRRQPSSAAMFSPSRTRLSGSRGIPSPGVAGGVYSCPAMPAPRARSESHRAKSEGSSAITSPRMVEWFVPQYSVHRI